MKKTIVILLTLVLIFGLILLPACNTQMVDAGKASTHQLTFEHDGLTREYTLYLPAGLTDNAPLVFVLHGYTQTESDAISFRMNDVADANGFAVCYPKGTSDDSGNSHWNSRFTISDTDDIGFLSELAVFLQTEHSLNPSKTYSCGFSNGGFMSYTLACEASDVFRAIASVGGTMSGYTWETRNIANPIPILQIHGTEDTAVPLDGSMSPIGGWGGAPPMSEVIKFWAGLSDCTNSHTEFIENSTNATYYTDGINSNEVWFIQIDNMGHDWPTAKDKTGTIAVEVIWRFFSKY